MSVAAIATYRWRHLASIIIYLECLYQIASSTAFVEAEIFNAAYHYAPFATILFVWYTDNGAQVIFLAIAASASELITFTLILEDKLSFKYLGQKIASEVLFFGSLSFIAMIFVYFDIL